MNRFSISFQHAGTEYRGFIKPVTKKRSKERPVKYFVWLNGNCWELIFYFTFECTDKPELSERLGKIVGEWWNGL